MRGHIRRRADSWELRICEGRDPDSGKYRYRTRTVGGSRGDAERAMELFRQEVTPFGALLERWYRETPDALLPASRSEIRQLIDYRLVSLVRLRPAEARLVAEILEGALAVDGSK